MDETIAEARRHGVPMYLNRYAMDGNMRRTGVRADRYLEDLEVAFRDERLDGFDLYELWALAGPSADGQRVEPPHRAARRRSASCRRSGSPDRRAVSPHRPSGDPGDCAAASPTSPMRCGYGIADASTVARGGRAGAGRVRREPAAESRVVGRLLSDVVALIERRASGLPSASTRR